MLKIFMLTLACLIPNVAFAKAKAVDVYFGTGGALTKGIYHAFLNTDEGVLSEATLVATVDGPGFLAMDPSKEHLYAVASVDGEPSVVAYKMEKDGDLEEVNSEPIGDGGGAHLSVHPSGNFLITAQYGGGSVAVFPIGSDGAIGKRSQLFEHEGGSMVNVRRQEKPHPHWTGYSPDGRFAFVPDLGMDKIVVYKVDAEESVLSPHGEIDCIPGGGPRHMRFSANGEYIYLLNELALSVTTFSYDAESGTATKLGTTRALSVEAKRKEDFNSASEILVHPNGDFVYSANRGHDSVTAYRVDQKTGKLSVVEVEPIRGSWPRNINLDPSSKWLLAAGARSNTVSLFEVDQESGELTFMTKRIINVPGAICIVFRD